MGPDRLWRGTHPAKPSGWIEFWEDGDPFQHIRVWAGHSITWDLPVEGWTVTADDLICPWCEAMNVPKASPTLVVRETSFGPVYECASCGKAGPYADLAAGHPGSLSGSRAPT